MRTFANAFNKNCDMDYLPKEKTEQMTQKKAKNIYKIVGFSLIALCFVLSYVYRPYAYAHHLNDFHLADCYYVLYLLFGFKSVIEYEANR